MRKSRNRLVSLLKFFPVFRGAHARSRPTAWCDACVALMLVSALASVTARAESPDERAARAATITTVNNQRVLRLRGESMGERGFAVGYLFANEMIAELETAIQSLPGVTVKLYNTDFLPWSKKNFAWDADAKEELDGLYAGMLARVGQDGMKSKVIGRVLTRDDLVGINTLADYFGPACSAFAAWGDRTADGKVIHGRTLDFPIGADDVALQVLIVADSLPARGPDHPARRAYMAIGWPGMITQYTGMNADGLVACIHDGYNVRGKAWHADPKSNAAGFIPRGLLLRRILESVDPNAGDPAEAAAKLVAAGPTACGNLFHLTWSSESAKKSNTKPSAVLEFDPTDRAPLIRRPDDPTSLVLTNHFCVLNKARECERFSHISDGLGKLAQANVKIGISEARKLLKSAEQPVAAHSAYFFPDSLEFYVALSRRNIMSPSVAPTKFSLKELFEK
ncbi:MAG TPA: C45 family autoproteolytic acyltransferase/hydrolase [Planctomycetota bacterium]|nr:C45 family autoproteolytic acyltransferase/hydrolase [Planctomycetota bacterium]